MHFLLADNLRAAGIPHAFTTRTGGYSQGPYASLNLGRGVEDDPAALTRNRVLVLEALDLASRLQVEASQVHGAVVAVVGAEDAGQPVDGVDGLVTAHPAVVLAVHAADCAPLLLAHRRYGVVAAVHSGWRGTAAGIAVEAVRVMADRFDCRPEDLLVAIGPAIGPCHYEVDEPVLDRMRRWSWWEEVLVPNERGRWQMDLQAANRRQLMDTGVQPDRIQVIELCTYHRPDLFFSYRRDRVTGRLAALIALPAEGNSAPSNG